jgi:hypothetical protein
MLSVFGVRDAIQPERASIPSGCPQDGLYHRRLEISHDPERDNDPMTTGIVKPENSADAFLPACQTKVSQIIIFRNYNAAA